MPHPSGRPWIIAHRGASLQARENTIEAFRLAATLGADAVELDARRTADGVIIVHHNDTLPDQDTPIIAMTRSEVARVAPWVPDLADAIEACGHMWVDLEVKNFPNDADWDPDDTVATRVAEAHGDADIVVTSFNPNTIAVAHRAGLRTGLLIRDLDPLDAVEAAATAGHSLLLPHLPTVEGDHAARVVDAARGLGVEIAVWTVDDPSEMQRLAAAGVGGIATNSPDVAHTALVG